MPYIILVFGIIAAFYALFRFFIKADPQQIKSLFMLIFISAFLLILFFFAATGRILIAIALVILSVPFIIAHFKAREKREKTDSNPDDIDDKKD